METEVTEHKQDGDSHIVEVRSNDLIDGEVTLYISLQQGLEVSTILFVKCLLGRSQQVFP